MNIIRKMSQRGDTIVEVMICLAVFGGMLSAAFVLTNRNQTTSQAAQERSTAVKIAEGQLEKLKSFVDDSEIPEFDYFCMDGNSEPIELGEDMESCASTESEGRYSSIIYSPAKAVEVGGNGNVFAVKTTWEGAITANEEVKIFYSLYDAKNTTVVAGGTPIVFTPPTTPTPEPEPEPEPEPGPAVTTEVNGADFSDCGYYYGYNYYNYNYWNYYYYGYGNWENEQIDFNNDDWASDDSTCYPIGPYNGYENSLLMLGGYYYNYYQSWGVEYNLDFKKGSNTLTIDYDGSYMSYNGTPATIVIGGYSKNVILPGGNNKSHSVELDIPDDVEDLSKVKIIFLNGYYYYSGLMVINKISVTNEGP